MLGAAGAAERQTHTRAGQTGQARIGQGARRREPRRGKRMRRSQRRQHVGPAKPVVCGRPDQVHRRARGARILQEDGEQAFAAGLLQRPDIRNRHAPAGDDNIGQRRGEKRGAVVKIHRPPGREALEQRARFYAAIGGWAAQRLRDAASVDLVTRLAGAQHEDAGARIQRRVRHASKGRSDPGDNARTRRPTAPLSAFRCCRWGC